MRRPASLPAGAGTVSVDRRGRNSPVKLKLVSRALKRLRSKKKLSASVKITTTRGSDKATQTVALTLKPARRR